MFLTYRAVYTRSMRFVISAVSLLEVPYMGCPTGENLVISCLSVVGRVVLAHDAIVNSKDIPT
jgi:hypothetical protein